MSKEFNDTGLCIPEKHYMADVSGKIQAIFKLVEQGRYFVINRPRQYGKTTTLYLLERELQTKPNYFPIFISFKSFGAESYQSEGAFVEALFSQLRPVFQFYKRTDLLPLLDNGQGVTTLNRLGVWFSDLVTTIGKRVVLMIDEVDKSSNNQQFLDFLAVLRAKFLTAAQSKDVTFHSVILAGVHDVKSLKLKMRPEAATQYNSPWNIAVDFTVDMSFSQAEIETILAEYVAETGVSMPLPQIAQRIFEYTGGYPFLVSKLCKIIDEEIREGPVWELGFIDTAVSKILVVQNTNFESLIKNLQNNPDLSIPSPKLAKIERLNTMRF